MSERMTSTEPTRIPPAGGKALWAARLQGFGRRGLITVLLGIAALWMHELFVDPEIRQGWKLKFLMVLIPLGVLAALALATAWMLARTGSDKR